jgi:hypothetical protein
MKRATVGALSLVLMAIAAAPQAVAGTLYFSQDGDPNGLYVLNATTGAPTLVGASGVTGGTVGLAPGAGPAVLYGSEPFGLLHINADGSGATLINGDPTMEGMAYDPTSGLAYGVWGTVEDFFSLNPNTGVRTVTLAYPVGAGVDLEGLAYNDGVVYALAGSGGNQGYLYAFGIASGTWSVIGDTGVAFDNCGLAYDTDRNLLYAIGDQDSFLYQINPATAALSVVGDTRLGETGGGLAYVPDAIPEPATLLLLGVGGLAVSVIRRSRRRQVA